VLAVLDDEPVAPPELLATAERVARRCFAATGEVLRSALPARLPASGAVRYRVTERGALASPGSVSAAEREILDALMDAGGEAKRVVELPGEGGARREALRSLEERSFVRAVSSARESVRRVEHAYEPRMAPGEARDAALGKRSRRGRDVLEHLDAIGRPATSAEIREATGAGPGVLKVLTERGLLRRFEQERREPAVTTRAGVPFHAPTPAQESALARIVAPIVERRFHAVLLQGVTGSGKTEVYLRAIRSALDAGRGAVWLVPEIALTPVFARELSRQFGPLAAVLHSALSERERADAWERVRRGDARAVIGPRSAAFAPVADPGLFVVDEEHDGSYKQRESPRYDARDVVALRAKENGAALVLGSATPSMEAWHAAESGRLERLLLPERIAGRPLPEVRIVDLRREPARAGREGRAALLRPPAGPARPGVRARRAGHPPAAATRLRALPPVPRVRRGLPLPALQRLAHRPREGEASRVPLLRRTLAGAAPVPAVRERRARGRWARGPSESPSASRRASRASPMPCSTATRRGAAAARTRSSTRCAPAPSAV
jgi:primosomal protein N' (replication factor Y)